MEDPLDDFVQKLQKQIDEETRVAWGDLAFQRWLEPLYMGAMKNADAWGRVTGRCGDTMEIFLRFEADKVKEASFQTDGCGSSLICGSFAAEMSLGKTLEELVDITGDQILEVLGGLPEEDRHCAFLAAETVQEAFNHYMIRQVKKGSDL